jgi:hypothetical protein
VFEESAALPHLSKPPHYQPYTFQILSVATEDLPAEILGLFAREALRFDAARQAVVDEKLQLFKAATPRW